MTRSRTESRAGTRMLREHRGLPVESLRALLAARVRASGLTPHAIARSLGYRDLSRGARKVTAYLAAPDKGIPTTLLDAIGCSLADYRDAVARDRAVAEAAAQESEVARGRFEAAFPRIAENATALAGDRRYRGVVLAGAYLSVAFLGGYELPLVVLAALWDDPRFRGPDCARCGGRVCFLGAGGSPLSGNNQCHGNCARCGRGASWRATSFARTVVQPALARLNALAPSPRPALPWEVMVQELETGSVHADADLRAPAPVVGGVVEPGGGRAAVLGALRGPVRKVP